ncbi:Serine/threonine-protein kinase plk-2 [Galdieria sulphuraria]|nr:Serine/threonine-protein kinase plk-2 [Galdieria sulphuraria]
MISPQEQQKQEIATTPSGTKENEKLVVPGVQVALENISTKSVLNAVNYKYAQLFHREQVSSAQSEVLRKFEKGRLLGKGGFAKVYQLTDIHTHQKYAGKIIPKNAIRKESAKQKLISEIRIHRELRHRHIVKFESCFEDQENVYIVLELCPNGSIMDMVRQRGRLTEYETRYFMIQILDAIRYMHRECLVIHRDLKLGNFFLDENMEVKIGDFGLAAQLSSDKERKRTICGTPNYIAPEILSGKQGHSFEVDIWSTGVVFYTMLVGKPPFETSDVKSTYKRIKENIYSIPESLDLSTSAIELIGSILNSDPAKRLSLDEIRSHPFFDAKIPRALSIHALKSTPVFEESELIERNKESSSYKKGRENRQQTVVGSSGLWNDVIQSISQDQRTPLQKLQQHIKSNAAKNNDHAEKLHQALEKHLQLNDNQSKKEEKLLESQEAHSKSTKGIFDKGLDTQSEDEERMVLNKVRDQLTSSFALLKNAEQSPYAFTSSLNTNDGTTSGSPSFQSPVNALTGGAWICSTGVCFNDGTQIILEKGQQNWIYYMKRTESHEERNENKWIKMTMEDYPSELQKKVKLLIHFRNYMLDHTPKGQEDPLISPESSFQNIDTSNETCGAKDATRPVYIKTWFRSPYAIIFRLSNRNIQVDFNDGTEVILSPEVHVVTYRGKDGRRNSYQQGHLPSLPELLKRLRYVMDLLQEMLNRKTS